MGQSCERAEDNWLERAVIVSAAVCPGRILLVGARPPARSVLLMVGRESVWVELASLLLSAVVVREME